MLRVAIAGCSGRMGKALVQSIVLRTDMKLTAATVTHGNPLVSTDVGLIAGIQALNLKPSDDIHKVIDQFDVLIDFTIPASTLQHLSLCKKNHKKMVIGTTGLNDEQKNRIQEASSVIPIMFAPNTSIGVNLCYELMKKAAAVLGDTVDIEIIEAHHRHKIDAPSGTALKMGEVIAQTLGRDFKQVAKFDRYGNTGERDRQTIGFSTIRGGDIVGDHTALFASSGERVEITHKASSRQAFATGALTAAKWLADKQSGLYSMADVLGFK
ncbi:MAG: 4-hydroxy-tetrahydrodipicolinate reductase [Candidatus Berkiella sp.]